MKITYVIDVLNTNLAGTENQLIKMIHSMSASGFNVDLICFRQYEWFINNRDSLPCRTHVVDIHRFNNPKTYINFVKFVFLLRSLSPDVVHTFFPVANIVGSIAARLAGVRVVISSRRDYGEWMVKRYLFATKLVNRFIDKVITNSNKVKELTVERESLDGCKIDVIYNGIDIEKFESLERDDSLKKDMGLPTSNKVVALVANFRPMKRHDTLIKAAKVVLQTRSDVIFLLIGGPVGDGTVLDEAKKLAKTLGVEDKIIFTGAREDVMSFLPIIDVGVNCSEVEGLSNAIMEYMAAGIPCVISNGGGNPDLVVHDKTGYLFEVGNFNSIAKYILELLGNEHVRDRFVQASRKFLHENMAMDVVMTKYANTYREMLSKKLDR